jgi:hypothetical protein
VNVDVDHDISTKIDLFHMDGRPQSLLYVSTWMGLRGIVSDLEEIISSNNNNNNLVLQPHMHAICLELADIQQGHRVSCSPMPESPSLLIQLG